MTIPRIFFMNVNIISSNDLDWSNDPNPGPSPGQGRAKWPDLPVPSSPDGADRGAGLVARERQRITSGACRSFPKTPGSGALDPTRYRGVGLAVGLRPQPGHPSQGPAGAPALAEPPPL